MERKALISIIYSTWKDGEGGDMYYQVDEKTGKKERIRDELARKMISEGEARVLVEYDSIPQIRLVLSDNPSNRAYKIDKDGKEYPISFEVAKNLLTNGRASIKDIELEKVQDPVLKTKSSRLYTSRFQNPTLTDNRYTVVGIVRYLPRFKLKYNLAGNIIDIAPTKALFNIYDRATFTPPYKQHLDEVGLKQISAQLKKYLDMGKDVALCCFCDVRKPDWCHRLVFAEWWQEKTGEVINELEDNSPIKRQN